MGAGVSSGHVHGEARCKLVDLKEIVRHLKPVVNRLTYRLHPTGDVFAGGVLRRARGRLRLRATRHRQLGMSLVTHNAAACLHEIQHAGKTCPHHL